jgi:ABC-2 type transport system permease protein
MTVTHMPGPTPLPRAGFVPRTKPTGSIVPDVLRSEFLKLRTVRSTYWTLLAAAIATIGLSVIVCAIYAAQCATLNANSRATFDPISSSLAGGFLAQLAIGVLGVLVITSEYGSGMIRETFAAVPQRLTVLFCKAAVFAGVTLVVTTAASFVAFFVGQAILSTKGIGVGIGAPGALRTVVGTGLYLAILGLLALGLGAIIRRTAGAIAALFGVIFVLPALSALLPSSMDVIQKFLPSNAGQALIGGSARGSGDLSPWVGFAVFCLYAVVALTVAGVTLVRRDA